MNRSKKIVYIILIIFCATAFVVFNTLAQDKLLDFLNEKKLYSHVLDQEQKITYKFEKKELESNEYEEASSDVKLSIKNMEISSVENGKKIEFDIKAINDSDDFTINDFNMIFSLYDNDNVYIMNNMNAVDFEDIQINYYFDKKFKSYNDLTKKVIWETSDTIASKENGKNIITKHFSIVLPNDYNYEDFYISLIDVTFVVDDSNDRVLLSKSNYLNLINHIVITDVKIDDFITKLENGESIDENTISSDENFNITTNKR